MLPRLTWSTCLNEAQSQSGGENVNSIITICCVLKYFVPIAGIPRGDH